MKYLIGTILLFFAFNTHAATVVKINVEVTNDDETTKNTNIITADDNKVRVDYISTQSDNKNPPPYLLTLDGGKSWIVGNKDGGKFYCANVKMEDFFRDLGDILARIDSFANAAITNDKTVILQKEPGPTMHGYATTHLKVQTTANIQARIMHKKFDYTLKKVDDVWYANDIGIHPVKQRWVQALTNSGYGTLDKLSKAFRNMIKGATLKHESIIEVSDNKKQKVDTYIRKLEVATIKEVKSEKLKADTFSKPECKDINRTQMKNVLETAFKESKLTL